MPITLTGMASGLDTESIISQLMAIEQNKVTAVQKRQVSVKQHKTDLQTVKTKLDAFKTAATDLGNASTVEGEADHGVLGPDQGRRHRARRRRHRRPLDPGRPPRLLRPARLQLHGRRQRGQVRLHQRQRPTVAIDIAANATAADVAAAINVPTSAPVYAAVVKDGGDDKRRLLLAQDRPELGLQRRHVAARRGHRRSSRTAPTRARARRSTRRTRSTAGAEQNPESNVLETRSRASA